MNTIDISAQLNRGVRSLPSLSILRLMNGYSLAV